jgi:hypothetical protein
MRVTFGGFLLYRLPNSIFPVTLPDLVNSVNVQGHPYKFESYIAARDKSYLYGTRMTNALATKVL